MKKISVFTCKKQKNYNREKMKNYSEGKKWFVYFVI